MARASKTTQDQIGRYRARIKSAEKGREDDKLDDTWRRLKNLYALKMFEGDTGNDQIAVAISFATINVIYPSISVNHPKTTVMARDPEDNDKAIISEAVLDWLWKSYDVGDEFRRAVKDFLIIGHGWIKTGYKYVEEQHERDLKEVDAEFAQMVEQQEQAAMEQPELAGDMPTDEQIMAGISSTNVVVREDRPFVERVSPHDVFIDPDATALGNARWIAQRIRRPLRMVHKDPTYDKAARAAVKTDSTSRFAAEKDGNRRREVAEDDKRATVWEFYDLEENTVCVFAAIGDGYLVKPTRMPYKIGHPFVMIRNYDVPDQFYPLGDLEALEPLQHELNRTRSQLMNARQQFARKHLIKGSAFNADARAALESPEDSMVVVNDGVDNLGELIIPVPTNPIPAELFSYGEMITNDINVVSGVSDYQRGASSEIRRTATEASMIQDAVNARSADKLGIIEKAVAAIGKNMMALARQYMTGNQTARIIGKAGLPIWIPFTQEDIDADLDFEVEGGSTMPKNEAWRQNQAMQLLQAVGPMIGQTIDPMAIAKYVLTQFGVKTPEKFIMEQPPMPPPGVGPGGPPDPNAPPPGPPPPMPDGQPMPDGMDPMTGDGMQDPSLLPTDEATRAQLAGQVGLVLPPQF